VPDATEITSKFVSSKPQSIALREVTALFLRLGFTAFGGPAAHIAMMEDEVVRRRNWLARDQFLDLLGVTSLIPGPSSTEMAILLGYRRAGWRGLVAGVCFILPAALIVAAIAWAYVAFGKLPQVIGVLNGVKPIVIAILLQALWRMGRTAIKGWWVGLIALLAMIANLAGVSPLAVLVGCGAAAIAPEMARHSRKNDGVPATITAIAPAAKAGAAVTPFKLSTLFLVFLKIGAVLFGSGYVLLAFLRGDFVDHLHWLSQGELLDAVAVGQVTPGPVFTTATFIGFVLGGWRGAAVATIGIFLPSFLLVAASGPLIPRLRRSRVAGAFLDGVNSASVALMAVVGVELGRAAIVDVTTVLLAAGSLVALLRWRVSSTWLVLAGGVVGAVASWMR